MAKVKTEYYVDPELFKQEIGKYYETEVCTHYLGDCLNKIAAGLGYSPCFIGYSYRDEMSGDAIVKMFSALKRKKYDMTSDSNPFSYFTTIAFHAFINRIKKEKKHHQTLTEYKEKVYFDTMQEDSNGGYIYVKPHVEDIEDAGFDSD